MRFLAFLSVICLVSYFPLSAKAQGHGGFCDKADSTAAAQECLKQHLESAQGRLNKVYQKLGASLEGKKLTELKDLQQKWLSYRDAECMWERERPETPALKIVNELSCMARVTEDRADILSIAYEDGKDINTQRNFGGFPRWMNAVAKDYPNILWNYGGRDGYDLNCDGKQEYVMQGVSYSLLENSSDKKNGDEKEEIEQPSPQVRKYSQEVVIAITQNPPTGRSDVQLFKFPVMDQEGVKNLCHNDVDLSFETIAAKKEADKSEDNIKSCNAILKIKDKNCSNKTILWGGKNFELDKQEKPKEEEND